MSSLTTAEIVEELKKRTEGLMFLSESDFPFNVFCCKTSEPLPQFFVKKAGRDKETVIEESPLSYLFKNLTAISDNKNEKLKENVMKYKKLLDYITNTLNDVKVYRIGEGKVDIFIGGNTNEGDYVFLSTKSLES